MAKVVFLIISSDVKFDLAMTMAANTVGTNRYEDFKVIFWGPSQERLLRLEGPVKDYFEKLLRAGAIDSACINYAKNKNIESELTKLNIKLHPTGDRVAYYINNGYQVLVF
jgi:hypothetical protein